MHCILAKIAQLFHRFASNYFHCIALHCIACEGNRECSRAGGRSVGLVAMEWRGLEQSNSPFSHLRRNVPSMHNTHIYTNTRANTHIQIYTDTYICIYSVYITYILINKDRHIFSHLLRNVHSLYSYIHVDTYTNTYNAPSLFDLIFGPRGQHSRYDIIIILLIKMIITVRVRNVIRAAAPIWDIWSVRLPSPQLTPPIHTHTISSSYKLSPSSLLSWFLCHRIKALNSEGAL